MKAGEILGRHKETVITRWTETVFNTYPLETVGFLRTSTDPFTNPVAHMTREAAGILYEAICENEVEPVIVKKALERFIRLRAVQKFVPSQNLAVLFLMKPLLRDSVLPEMQKYGLIKDYLQVESRLDTLVLLAFDLFMNARETLAEARIKEIRNQYAQLANWARRMESGSLKSNDEKSENAD